jgi:hypothetical protein
MERAVECNSTLDVVNGVRCGVELDVGRGNRNALSSVKKRKSLVPVLSLVTVLTELSRVLFEHVDTESAVVARTVSVYSVQTSQ